MAARNPPESWFWSHDINPKHPEDADIPNMYLTRFAIYGHGRTRRLAGIMYSADNGTQCTYLVDVPRDQVEAKVRDSGAHPVSITADTDTGQLLFTLVLHKGPSSLYRMCFDLSEPELLALVDDKHCVTDLCTYVIDGVCKYAAIVEERTGPCWIFNNVTAQELDSKVVALGAVLTRVRRLPPAEGPQRFTAVAERLNVGRWAWFTGIPSNVVARQLSENDGYPVDLEAWPVPNTKNDVHYTVVMYQDRPH